jgi:peptidyl-prolyl cis-trans isomerase C
MRGTLEGVNQLVISSAILPVVLLYGQTPPPKPAAQPTIKVDLNAPPPAPMPGPEAVVMTVGGEKITRNQWEELIKVLPQQVQVQMATAEGRRRIAEQIAELKAVSQEAKRQKFDADPRTRTILQLQAEQTLATNFIRAASVKASPTEADLRKVYEEEKDKNVQVTARHILIRFQGSPVPVRAGQKDLTEEEARAKALDLKKQILAGADFTNLAKAESDDSGSGAQGGELGTFGRGQMVKEFEEVALQIEPGQVSEPVRSQFGYHLIDVKSRKSKTFAESKSEIEARLKPQMSRKIAENIKKAAAIVFDEAYFGKPIPPQQAGLGGPAQ